MPAPQPTADDLQQVLDRLAQILQQGILTANRGLLDLDWVRREWWAVTVEDDPAKAQFEQFVREFYDA